MFWEPESTLTYESVCFVVFQPFCDEYVHLKKKKKKFRSHFQFETVLLCLSIISALLSVS